MSNNVPVKSNDTTHTEKESNVLNDFDDVIINRI